ncbi:MAG: hypothetical protein ACYS14_02765, partial [Planctomycetota bacterium]
MKETSGCKRIMSRTGIFFCLWLCISSSVTAAEVYQPAGKSQLPQEPCDRSEIDLKTIPFKILYETYRQTSGEENWELFLMNADGSDATNLTQTPDVHEMY